MRIANLAKKYLSLPEVFIDELLNNYAGELPKLLSYFPAAQVNPFQKLLYSRSSEFGYMVLPFTYVEDIGSIHWHGRSVIHLHWIAHVLQGIECMEEGESRISAFIAMVQQWRYLGNKVIWTMHNLIPHNSKYPDAEYRLREQLIKNIDAVHIMNKDSVEIAKPYYDLPQEKVFYVPHPSFTGFYQNVIGGKNAARSHLMLEPDAFYFLFFGSLTPYKEIEKMIAVFNILVRDYPQIRLIIAGLPSDKEYMHKILSLAVNFQSILVIPRKIQDDEIQYFMNASDIVILPYNTLNSGSAAVAIAFNKHCIGPKDSGVSCIFGEEYPLLFDSDEDEALLRMMKFAISYVNQTPREISYEPSSSFLFFSQINRNLL